MCHIHSLWCCVSVWIPGSQWNLQIRFQLQLPMASKVDRMTPRHPKTGWKLTYTPWKIKRMELKDHPFETGKLNLPSTSMTLGWIVDFLECNFSFSPFLWRFCHPYPSFQDTNLCAIHAKRVTIMPKAFGGPEWQNRCNNCNLKLL